MRRTRRLPRTLNPADFTNFLTSGATLTNNFWFLNFTFPYPIIEFPRYIRFWRFYGIPYIAMCGLLLLSYVLQLKHQYIAPELFLLLMTSLFTFYHCLLSAIFCVVFMLLASARTLHLPYLTSYIPTFCYLTSYLTLPHILPFITLP